MQIGGKSEREIGENSSGEGRVEVLRVSARDELPEEAHGNCRREAEEEPEHSDRYSDRRRHGIHVELHS